MNRYSIKFDPYRGFYVARRRPYYDLYTLVFIGSVLAIYLSKYFVGTPLVGVLIALLISFAAYSMKNDATMILFGFAIVMLWASLEYTRTFWLFGMIWLLAIAYIYSKGTPPSSGKMVLYNPPREVRPPEMAYLVEDREANEREFLVAVMDLVNRGYIELIPTRDDFYIRKQKEYEGDQRLTSVDRFVLHRLFLMTGVRIVAETGIPLQKDEFPNEVSLKYVMDDLHNWAKAFDLQFRSHLSEDKPIYHPLFVITKRQWQALAIAILIAGLFFLFIRGFYLDLEEIAFSKKRLIWNMFFGDGLPIVAVSGAIFWLSYHYVGVLTDFGKKVMHRVLGYREFLKRVELPRLKRFIKEKRFTLMELFTYALALKLFDLIDLWIESLRSDEGLAEEILVIERLWNFLRWRWKLARFGEKLDIDSMGRSFLHSPTNI